ncbi:MAG: 3'-5' exonuclease [Candidatus Moranbacteria bacterium]|nr:3'-5' exonuclease [Candidatus Moranbacteria bacterium]
MQKQTQDILSQLNEKQQEAVTQTEGPVLVLAGAGSGKTRALTFRAAYLIKEKKVPPKNILAVTFTNKAAEEMRGRIKDILGLPQNIPPYSQYLPHIGTFHSICVKILRKEIEKKGYSKNFLIYDDQDQLAMIKKVMKEMEVSQDQLKPKAVLGTISKSKSNLIDAEGFIAQSSNYFEELVGKCYESYQSRLKKADALDFDDLIMLAVKIFNDYPDVLRKYQELFRYIMVDEYQDTNYSQYKLIKILGEKHRNIYTVGDDFQSIYGWRMADIRNILNFEKDYPEAKVVLLDQNYRSTQNILDAAHCIIEKNKNQKKKKLWTQNEAGELLTILEVENEKEEARFVVDEVARLKEEKNLSYNDFAVLYRTNAQSRAIEEAFLKKGMPYRIVGGVKFYQRKEVKDILSYLYLLYNPSDEVSFERIVNLPPRGIGKKTVEKIIQLFRQSEKNLLETLQADRLVQAGVDKGKAKKLEEFAFLMQELRKKKEAVSVSELIDLAYNKSGYKAMLMKDGEEGEVRHENIQELLTVARKFDDDKQEGLASFLEEIALVSQTDEDLKNNDAVPLMTIHSAKGLEFNRVFLVGAEEGLFPHSRAIMNESEMEEERRLCYVGITRAKEKAYLTFTAYRNIYGSTQSSIKSRFLEEISAELIEENYFENEKEGFSDDFYEEESVDSEGDVSKDAGRPETFQDGDQVEHPDFGKGMVISQDENLVTIAFPGVGLKKLSKQVAPLRKID